MIAELVAAIDEDPDDDARFLVLADALTAVGDPRGELIVLQHALAQRFDATLARAEQEARRAAWGELDRYRWALWDVHWRLGFLETLAIESEAPTGAIVRVLCRAPVARWLRDLRVGTWHRDDDPHLLAGLPNLGKLRIKSAGGFTDDDLHTLARFPRLAEVSLGECELSAHGLATMPETRLESLRFVSIRGFSDAHVAATAKLPIRTLEIHGAAISDASFATIGESLRSIALSFCPGITSGVFTELAQRPLTGLDLADHEPFDGAELARLERGTLEELLIHPVSNVEAAVLAASRHARLRTVQLAGVFGDRASVGAASLARLCELPTLRDLHLRCQGEIAGAGAITDSRIERLELYANAVPADFAASLAIPSLRELRLIALPPRLNAWVDDAFMAVVGRLASLEELSVRDTSITDAGLEHLHGLATLAMLDLYGCKQLTAQGLAALVARLPALRVLDIGAGGIESLAGLADHPSISHLRVAALAVSDVDLAIAATMPCLDSLKLKRTRISDAGIEALLPAATRLRVLDLEDCAITARSLAILEQFHALERLSLRGTPIDDRGAGELAAALPGCRISR